MKKNMMFLSVVVLFVAILGCRSADAGVLSGLKEIPSALANAGYHISMAECRAELVDLDNQIVAEFNRYGEKTRGQHDLRRQLNDCQHDREDVFISLEECHEMNGTMVEEGPYPYGSPSAGGLENHGGPYPVIDRNLFAGAVDFMVNGTCEEPKTDHRKDAYLSGCRAIAEWLRDELARATYRADHVEESMREDIAYCQLDVGSLQNELMICNNGGNVGDTVDPLSSPEGDVMICTVDAEGNEVCTTEGDETCTLDPNDPEGKKLCPNSPSLDPSADTAADSGNAGTDNEGTGGDQEPASFMDLVKRLVQNFKKDPSSSSILRRVSAMQ